VSQRSTYATGRARRRNGECGAFERVHLSRSEIFPECSSDGVNLCEEQFVGQIIERKLMELVEI
jgi:hypothetical protein